MDFTKDEIELIKSCIEAKVESVHDNALPPDPIFYDVPGGHLDTAVKLINLDYLLNKIKGIMDMIPISFTKDEKKLMLDCFRYNIHGYHLMIKSSRS